MAHSVDTNNQADRAAAGAKKFRGSAQDRSSCFSEEHVLHELRHYLPSQTPLKDFIHHNTLHAFQQSRFYDAIFLASKVFGYQVTLTLAEFRQLYIINRIRPEILERVVTDHKGTDSLNLWLNKLLRQEYRNHKRPRVGRLRAHWKSVYDIDLDKQVHPLLFRTLCSYLDQGIATWSFPAGTEGLLAAVAKLEETSFSSFFKTKRARTMLLEGSVDIYDLLKILVGDDRYFEQYIFDQQFSHRGWSGMVATLEAKPDSLYDYRAVALRDAIIFELLLEIDTLDYHLGASWQPLSSAFTQPPINLLAPEPMTESDEVLMLWQDAFEWSYYDQVIAGLTIAAQNRPNGPRQTSFQAIFCIDERECSLRRYVEQTDTECATFGTPGFFGVEFYFQPQNGKFYDKLCPAPVTPKYLIKETEVTEKQSHELLYTNHTHSLLSGFAFSLFLGVIAGGKLVMNVFRPKMSPAISNAFAQMGKGSKLTIENKDANDIENGLQIGFTVPEMAVRVEAQLRSIGLTANFAPLVYVVAHGSSSANNPHHGAHDCGACSGRPGAVNARVLASMANNPRVRAVLAAKGVVIPNETQFVGALHDTAGDKMEFYDIDALSAANAIAHVKNVGVFERALDKNAKERSRRFASINTRGSLAKVRKAISDRSVSLFEPRPELGHGTNTLCIVGRRSLTKGLFLDRRAFLNSYDYTTDPEGLILARIMRPLGPVCGGINLEYYFSRVDNHKLGAGTKLPHNLMGLIGVSNGCDGDLLPGLPLQMIEVHDPVRLLLIVEHYPEVVLKTIQSEPAMYEWYINEWVHLVAMNPDTGVFYYFKEGAFSAYHPSYGSIGGVDDIATVIERAAKMETNSTVDATRENLPVYTIN